MTITPWPRPITRKEFNKRYAEGKRTLFELNPKLKEWYDQNHNFHLFGLYTTISLGIVTAIMLIVLMLRR